MQGVNEEKLVKQQSKQRVFHVKQVILTTKKVRLHEEIRKA